MTISPSRRAMFLAAQHCQGGHSEAGAALAEQLGVPFPLNMGSLVARVRAEGENPARMYPWLIKMARRLDTDQHDYFTQAEIEAAA